MKILPTWGHFQRLLICKIHRECIAGHIGRDSLMHAPRYQSRTNELENKCIVSQGSKIFLPNVRLQLCWYPTHWNCVSFEISTLSLTLIDWSSKVSIITIIVQACIQYQIQCPIMAARRAEPRDARGSSSGSAQKIMHSQTDWFWFNSKNNWSMTIVFQFLPSMLAGRVHLLVQRQPYLFLPKLSYYWKSW